MTFGTRRRTLVDMESGEVVEVEQVTRGTCGGRQFWKAYLPRLLDVIDGLEGRQVTVLAHVLRNTNPSTNLFLGTYQEIMDGTHVCRQTVAETMGRLKERGFARKVGNGVWMVNPDVIMKGNDNKRTFLLSRFRELGDGGEPSRRL